MMIVTSVPTSGTLRLTCDPIRMRDSRSRPRVSVPNRKIEPPSSTPNRWRSIGKMPSQRYGSPRTKNRT